MTSSATTDNTLKLTFLVDHFFNSGQKKILYIGLLNFCCLPDIFLPNVLVKALDNRFTDLNSSTNLILMHQPN